MSSQKNKNTNSNTTENLKKQFIDTLFSTLYNAYEKSSIFTSINNNKRKKNEITKKVNDIIMDQINLLEDTPGLDTLAKFNNLVENQILQAKKLEETSIENKELILVEMHGGFSSNIESKIVPDNIVLVFLSPINHLGYCSGKEVKDNLFLKTNKTNILTNNLFCINKNEEINANNINKYFIDDFLKNATILYPKQKYYNLMLEITDDDYDMGVFGNETTNLLETKPVLTTLSSLIDDTIIKSTDIKKIKYIFLTSCRYFDTINDKTKEIYLYELFIYCFNYIMNQCRQTSREVKININIFGFLQNLHYIINSDNKSKRELNILSKKRFAHQIIKSFNDDFVRVISNYKEIIKKYINNFIDRNNFKFFKRAEIFEVISNFKYEFTEDKFKQYSEDEIRLNFQNIFFTNVLRNVIEKTTVVTEKNINSLYNYLNNFLYNKIYLEDGILKSFKTIILDFLVTFNVKNIEILSTLDLGKHRNFALPNQFVVNIIKPYIILINDIKLLPKDEGDFNEKLMDAFLKFINSGLVFIILLYVIYYLEDIIIVSNKHHFNKAIPYENNVHSLRIGSNARNSIRKITKINKKTNKNSVSNHNLSSIYGVLKLSSNTNRTSPETLTLTN